MKKVLAIAPYPYLPFFSGGQKFIAQFLERLGAEKELTVISVAENDLSLARTYRILPLLKTSFSRYLDRSLIASITELVKKEGFDTIICEHPYFAWLVFAVRKRTGVTVIIHTHNIEYQRFRSMGKWWWPVLKGYEKRSFQKADRVFFITPEDRDFAIREWGIAKDKCIDVPFGIELQEYPGDRAASRKRVAAKHGIGENEKLFSFNGLLDYKPNLDALNTILQFINPLLLQQQDLRYKIIISGKNLPASFNELKDYADRNIIYTGFVDDISSYLEATDIFLNPVQTGGGIKTKMVEAIGYGATVVSTQTGAVGIEKNSCGEKLVVVADNDWDSFSQAVAVHSGVSAKTPAAYYHHYYWGHIIQRAVLAG
jgi:polysaccharide biosynthesis protein PslH